MRRLIAAIVALAALVLGGGAGYSGFKTAQDPNISAYLALGEDISVLS